MKNIVLMAFVMAAALKMAANVEAHDGRRIEVVVIDNKLYGQGYLSGTNPIDDGGGIVRPYLNAIHAHFENALNPNTQSAEATLPSFDIFNAAAEILDGADVYLDLLSATKWDQPTPQDTSLVGPARLGQDFQIPDTLPALGPGDQPIFVGFEDEVVSTFDPGRLTLATDLNGPAVDLDLRYQIDDRPENILYVLEWQLSTTQVGIESSDSLYTILSPDGTGVFERLHFQSLALERNFGVTLAAAVPEPGSVAGLAACALAFWMRRKR